MPKQRRVTGGNFMPQISKPIVTQIYQKFMQIGNNDQYLFLAPPKNSKQWCATKMDRLHTTVPLSSPSASGLISSVPELLRFQPRNRAC